MSGELSLNSFGEIWEEFNSKYAKEPSFLRGFDAIALFCLFTAILQAVYGIASKGYPFQSLISSLCGSLGTMILVIALRIHLAPGIQSTVTPERAFVDFLLSLALLFLFVWNIMI